MWLDCWRRRLAGVVVVGKGLLRRVVVDCAPSLDPTRQSASKPQSGRFFQPLQTLRFCFFPVRSCFFLHRGNLFVSSRVTPCFICSGDQQETLRDPGRLAWADRKLALPSRHFFRLFRVLKIKMRVFASTLHFIMFPFWFDVLETSLFQRPVTGVVVLCSCTRKQTTALPC